MRAVDARVILNSFSLTGTVAAAGLAVVVVVDAGTVCFVVVVCCVVVVAAAAVVSAAAASPWCLLSAPNTSTAVSIPKKKTKATTMNASSPRPG